ncbi:MAG: hypothetical protein HYX66_08775 [Ignavibacteria bacterium]|nr:hypothetical protein [Ignavibacteria bacterium]
MMLTRIEQINELLDGDLDQMLESGLYAELAVNPDLRTELRNQLAVKSAVQHDRMALIPPAQLTNSVFTHLGFAAPLAGAAAGAAGGSLILAWLSKLGLPLLSALAATGITYVATTSIPARSPVVAFGDKAIQTSANASLSANPVNGATIDNSTPVQRNEPRQRDLQGRIATLQNENDALRSELAKLNSESEEVPPEPVFDQLHEAPEPPLQNVIVRNEFAISRKQDQRMIKQSELQVGSDLTAYPAPLLQIRGFSLKPTTESAVPPESNWYSNISVGAFYRLNRVHMLGLEFGSETFPLVYRGEQNDQLKQWDQSSSLLWAGVSYRYTFEGFRSLPIAPFTQVFGGGTKLGPLGRAIVGFEYSPAGPFSFILGAEAAVLAYRFDTQWYASPKYGLTYGMTIRF